MHIRTSKKTNQLHISFQSVKQYSLFVCLDACHWTTEQFLGRNQLDPNLNLTAITSLTNSHAYMYQYGQKQK